MSATRDPDRILRAWLDQMPSEAPDRAIDAVLLATSAAPQVWAWPWHGRWRPNQMNRLSLIAAAAAAVVILAIAGGAMLLSGSKGPGPTATPAATPTAAPTATPGPGTGTTPVALRSWWVANAPAGSAGAVLTLEIQPSLVTVRDAGSESVVARVAAGTAGELAIAATDAAHGCQKDDVGRYTFAFAHPAADVAAGDMQLGLTATGDTCAGRRAILERTWTRVFTNGFKGGRAVGIDFDPMFMVTLPAGNYNVSVSGKDALMVEGPKDGDAPGMFVATRNPAGFTDPCSETGGDKKPILHTVDAFAAYIDSLPGFTVQRTNVTIAGLPAVHLAVPTTITTDCPRADHRIIEWSTADPTFPNHWILGQGDPDSMYLVEVGSDLYLLQWLNPTNDPATEMSVLSTLTFINTIPG